MPLDPQARLLLDFLASQNAPDVSTLSPRGARLLFAEHRARSPAGPDARVEDALVPSAQGSIPVRIYKPLASSAPLPVLMWFHGGGHVIGSVPESDSECRELATLARCAVVSVEYRLAPEHPFPAAADDCFTATKWVAEHPPDLGVDASRIAVGGDSAGGNLAAVVSLMARDRGGPALVFQLLVYPGTDYASLDTKSHHENAEGYFLTRPTMLWFRNQYVPKLDDRLNPYVSPLRAESLEGLPRALVMTAEYDPLRDEGEAYGARLEQAGGSVVVRRYDGMIHGFLGMRNFLDKGKVAMSDAAAALASVFGLSQAISP
jgi:acetyl esterase